MIFEGFSIKMVLHIANIPWVNIFTPELMLNYSSMSHVIARKNISVNVHFITVYTDSVRDILDYFQ